MTFGSLFAGIGGFDLGFERAGMRCVWQVERDKQCLDLLANKWPESIRVNDIIKARFLLEPKYAGRMDAIPLVRPDVICGGFPCQDLSIAGKRRGLAGSRSGLFWTMRRIIALLKPPWIVLENVPGLLSSSGGRDMGAVIGALADSGYGVAWRVMDSQFFGLAQRRKRVFIVGHLGDVRRAGQILFDGESLSRDSPPSRETREEVAYETSPSLRASGVGVERAGDTRGQDCVVAQTLKSNTGRNHIESDYVVAATLRSRQSKPGVSMPGRGGEDDQNLVVSMTLNGKQGSRYDAESETFVTHALTGNGFDASEDGTGRGTPIIQIDMRQASRGEKMTNKRKEGTSGGAPGAGIGNAGDPSPTLSDSHTPAIGGAFGVRRLMPIECERLQGFPDNWTEGFSDSVRYRMLGNAVSVPVAEWIGRRIVEACQ